MKMILLLALLSLATRGASMDFNMFASPDPTENCKISNEELWNVIERFYGSSNLVSIYFIHPQKPNASQFDLSSALLQGIPKSKLQSPGIF